MTCLIILSPPLAPGLDLSTHSDHTILRSVQILVPQYLDDLMNGGFYENFKALVRLLLDQHPTSTAAHPSIDSQDVDDVREPDAVTSVPPETGAINESKRNRKSKWTGSLVSFPAIQSQDLERRVFTRGTRDAEGHLNNRRLEWLGDAVLQLSATLLLEDNYPRIRNRVATEIRALVVSNRKLSQISRKYKLYKRCFEISGRTLNPTADSKAHGMVRVVRYIHGLMCHFLADLFEAYVGALFKEQDFLQLHQFLTDLLLPPIVAANKSKKVYKRLAKKVASLQVPAATIYERITRAQPKTTPAALQTTSAPECLAPKLRVMTVASVHEKESGTGTEMTWQAGEVPSREGEAHPSAKFINRILSPFNIMCQSLGYEPHIDTYRTFTEAGIWQWVTDIYVGEQLISTCTALTQPFSEIHACHDASAKIRAVRLK